MELLITIEQQKGLSVWNADSDGDGFSDYYELSNNLKANEKDQSLTDMMKTILKSKDEKYDMAYKVNGVVLWADDIKSRTYGRVIRTPDGGYQFTNFKGYGSYDWVGLRNYKDLFTDSRVGGSYIFTFKLAIAATIFDKCIESFAGTRTK